MTTSHCLTYTRVRWTIVRDNRDTNNPTAKRPEYNLMGTSWLPHVRHVETRPGIDPFPISFATRREARNVAQELMRKHSYWTKARWRVARLTTTYEATLK